MHATASGSAAQTRGPAAASATAKPARALVTVTDASGPLAGATVRLSHDGDVTTLQTGADGSARADNLEAGDWQISATADGHEPAGERHELRAGETTKLDLKLATGGRTLTGTVTDASGGPIGGARIDAAKLDRSVRASNAVATTLTGADGTYKLTVAEGQLLVAASEPSYSAQSRYVEVTPAGAKADFQLVPGGVIEGVVRDERSHDPVAAILVEAGRDTPALFGESATRRVTTNADGRFRLAGLRPGAYSLTAKGAKLAAKNPTLVGLGVAEQVTDVEILVGGAPSIRGVVVDEQGTPAADVEIRSFGPGDDITGKSDAKGVFVIDAVSPGQYSLVASSDQFMPASPTRIEVADKDVDGIKITVSRGLRIKGHVERRQVCEVEADAGIRRPGMMPMRFAPVTTTDDGEFEIGPVRPGALDLEAHCASGDVGATHVEVSPTLGPVAIDVKPGGSIAGKVVDGQGKPVAAVTVMAGDGSRTTIVNGMVSGGVQAVTDARGEFALHGLTAGSYALRVLDRGRPLPTKSDNSVTLSNAEAKTGITLAVERPDGTIRGIVVGADGKPIADAWVSLDQSIEDLLAAEPPKSGSRMITVEARDDGDGDGGIAPVLTDSSGKFEIANLPRVPFTVVAEAQAGKLRGRQSRVIPDASITLQALGVTELSGTVKPAPGVFTVELDGPTRAQRSFSGDKYSFGRVDPGEYTVSVTSSAGNGRGTITVKPGQAATLDIALASNAIVIGKLVDPTGKPLGGLPVAVIPDASDGSLKVQLSGPPPMSAPDGTFRIEAKAGPSAVLVLVPPRPVSKRGLILEPGKTLDAGAITVEPPSPTATPRTTTTVPQATPPQTAAIDTAHRVTP
jgi:protocatechuate 3,4-dioxygenase beta subunit